MHKHRLAVWLFGAMASVLLALLTFTTMKNANRDKALIRNNALSKGYWIARSLEIAECSHDHGQSCEHSAIC